MRWIGVAALLLVLAGCGDDEPTSSEPTAMPSTSDTAPDPGQTEAARAVVEAYYEAFGLSDCITMRLLSTPDEQREDDAWADCIVVVGEVGVSGYGYEVVSGAATGDEATFVVAASGDVGTTTDDIRLLLVDGAWLVDDSLVTDI